MILRLMPKSLMFLLFTYGLAFHHWAWADRTLTWAGCGVTKTAFMAELAQAYEKRAGVKINIKGGGATLGIRGISANKYDMGGTCRYTIEGNPQERGVLLKPVAWDALAVIVNNKNKIANLSVDQIKGIFTGRIKNWSEIGGNNAPIELYVRSGKISGVELAVRTLLFDNKNMDFHAAAKQFPDTAPLETAIEENPNAVGMSGVSSARKRNLKLLNIDGKEPSFDNIKAGTYILYRPLYLVLAAGETRTDILNFVKFTHSAQGRQILRDNGTLPYLDALHLVLKQVDQYLPVKDTTMAAQQ